MKFRAWALTAFLFLLAACSDGPADAVSKASAPLVRFEGSDVRGENLGGDFLLTAHNGRTIRLSDYRGKVLVLVFGFTHCPDVCPTHLLTYAQAMAKLTPEEAKQVQLFFVSVDPARDRPE